MASIYQEDKKSKIAFCVHDSLVLDVCHKEKDLINEIIEKFSGTKIGFGAKGQQR